MKKQSNFYRMMHTNNNLSSAPPAAPAGVAYTWDTLTGVTNTAGTLRKTAATGSFSNNVATSNMQTPVGNFVITFTLASGTFDGGMIGLKSASAITAAGGHTQYAYAFNLNDFNVVGANQSQVWEAGSSTGVAFDNSGGEVMVLRLVGTSLTYERNGVVLRTVSITPAAFYFGCNIYTNAGNDFFTGATLA